MNVGDKVMYVPDICHALIANIADHRDKGVVKGEYPWVIEDSDGNEIPPSEMRELVKRMRNRKRTPDQMGLKFVKPKTMWPAVVAVMLPDGKVSLDVDHPNSAVTLHVTVEVDATGIKPHTCFAPQPTRIAAPKSTISPPQPEPEPKPVDKK